MRRSGSESEREIETKILLEDGWDIMKDWENYYNRVGYKARERGRVKKKDGKTILLQLFVVETDFPQI